MIEFKSSIPDISEARFGRMLMEEKIDAFGGEYSKAELKLTREIVNASKKFARKVFQN